MPATTAVTVRAASCGGPSPVTGGPPAEPVVHLGAARDGGLQLAETRPGQPVQGGEVARHAHFPAAQLRLDQPGVLQVQHRGADRRPVPGGFGGQGGQAQEDAGAVQVGGVAEDPGDMFQRGRAQPGPISAGAGPAAARIVTPPRRGARRVLHGLQPRELVSEPPVRPRPASRSQHPAPPLQPGSLWPPGPPPAKGGNHRRPRGSQKLIIERRGWPAVKARPDRRPRPSSRPPSATAGRPTGGRSCGTAGPAPRPGPPAPPMASASPPAAPPPGPRPPRNRPTRPAPPAWPAATGAASPPATGAASLPALRGRGGAGILGGIGAEGDRGDDWHHGRPPASADRAVVTPLGRDVVGAVKAVEAAAALRRGGAAVPAILGLPGLGEAVRLALVALMLGVAAREVRRAVSHPAHRPPVSMFPPRGSG